MKMTSRYLGWTQGTACVALGELSGKLDRHVRQKYPTVLRFSKYAAS
jgi:hypothetical protein